jgi:hypothetical protein
LKAIFSFVKYICRRGIPRAITIIILQQNLLKAWSGVTLFPVILYISIFHTAIPRVLFPRIQKKLKNPQLEKLIKNTAYHPGKIG